MYQQMHALERYQVLWQNAFCYSIPTKYHERHDSVTQPMILEKDA